MPNRRSCHRLPQSPTQAATATQAASRCRQQPHSHNKLPTQPQLPQPQQAANTATAAIATTSCQHSHSCHSHNKLPTQPQPHAHCRIDLPRQCAHDRERRHVERHAHTGLQQGPVQARPAPDNVAGGVAGWQCVAVTTGWQCGSVAVWQCGRVAILTVTTVWQGGSVAVWQWIVASGSWQNGRCRNGKHAYCELLKQKKIAQCAARSIHTPSP
jgi:hypothetical protein